MGSAAYQDAAAAQDQLRPVRNFVALLGGAFQDQTYADTDAYAVNLPRQYGVQGPNGVAVEGQPVVVAGPRGSAGPSPLLIVGALVAVYLLMK